MTTPLTAALRAGKRFDRSSQTDERAKAARPGDGIASDAVLS